MADDDVDPSERLREDLDEMHERLAALSGRVADLERDRDALYAEAEAQVDRMERTEALIRRSRLSLLKAVARAAASRGGVTATAGAPGAESTGDGGSAGSDDAAPTEQPAPGPEVG